MRLQVFDVEHGFCALAEQAGATMMFDCGQGSWFRPSTYIRSHGLVIDELLLSHRHEDHLSELEALLEGGLVRVVRWNGSMPQPEPNPFLRLLTNGRAVNAFESFRASSLPVYAAPSLPGVSLRTFCLSHWRTTNENDLSVVTFLQYGSTRIAIPGDLEKAGWREHLRNPAFRDALYGTDIFIASHHGRENGYCSDVFHSDLCRPDVIIVSDAPRQYASQECDYGPHARGVSIEGVRRNVLTTRRDGHITIDVEPFGYTIRTESARRHAMVALLQSIENQQAARIPSQPFPFGSLLSPPSRSA